ncbi:chloride channel protein [Fodinibius salsisoli]|uniref:Chloride channel protein n=1 Tax=Fodinibius salsisoli TaxID=2820877 RepID=A0ABT3PKG0_9BACT|nr:chloride channel protein [Fodinibius salsisoli]MCW9706429.1 chloride channel protein [Fodinibius salsisoli]
MFSINSRKLRTNLHDLGQAVNMIITGRWLFYCVIIGILAGLFALLFNFLFELIQEVAIHQLAGTVITHPDNERIFEDFILPLDFFAIEQPWLLFFLPALGGLISGLIVYKFAPQARGHGNDAVIEAYHSSVDLKSNIPFTKLLASVFTIGTGGSAGKEGPIAQIGAGIGSYVSKKLDMGVRERRIFMMAGLAAGIGAIFKAPIGAALFSSEVLYRSDFESEGLVAGVISSIISYSVYASVTGWESIFSFQPVSFSNPYELPLFILLAVIVMVAGILYTKIFNGIKTLFDKVSLPFYLKPMVGGLLVGIIGFFFPAVLGTSYGSLQAALHGNLTIPFMLTLVVLKMVATSFTIQSGGSGGVFGPSLVIGGLLGGVLGYTIEMIAPGTITSPEAFVLVGMASFFSAVANVPVSSTILISEMSKSYGLIVPLIFASAVAYLGAQSWSIYKQQLENRFSSTSYRDDFLSEVMQHLKVRSAFQKAKYMPVINHRWRASQILDEFSRADSLILPVDNDDGDIIGMISLYDVRMLLQKEVGDVIIAADIMVPPKLLKLNDSFSTALDYFRESGEPELPILRPGSENQFIGVLSEREFLLKYEQAMSRSRG